VSAAIELVVQLLHVLLMLAAAPLLVGGIGRLQARLVGRDGPPLLQPYRDLLRLSRKQPVLADSASWLFAAAPVAAFTATLTATALVPSFALGMTTAPLADLIVIAGLLLASRCITALAAMDSGTALGGIGASRAAAIAVFTETALLLVVFALALLAGTTNLDVIAGLLREGTLGLRLALALAIAAIVIVALADSGRLPLDGPATRLGLGAAQDAMALDYSGRHLALVEWGAALRLLLWLSLISAILVPFGMAEATDAPVRWLAGLVAWALKIAVLAVALAVFETRATQMRLLRAPEFVGVAVLLGLLAMLALFVGQGFS
jgi:formate hydrogenlyase subunit 4